MSEDKEHCPKKKKCPVPEATEDICPEDPPYSDRSFFDPNSEDGYVKARATCEKSCEVKPVREQLLNCERRVYQKRHYTAETCEQELVDMLEAIDKCLIKQKTFLDLA